MNIKRYTNKPESGSLNATSSRKYVAKLCENIKNEIKMFKL